MMPCSRVNATPGPPVFLAFMADWLVEQTSPCSGTAVLVSTGALTSPIGCIGTPEAHAFGVRVSGTVWTAP